MTIAIYHGPRRALSIDTDDALWAARGCYGEAGIAPSEEVLRAYLWAIMRRCLLLRSNRTYGQMWRAFSQPINPRWLRDGDMCRVGSPYHGRPECDEHRLLRREMVTTMSALRIPKIILAAVNKMQTGTLPTPGTEGTRRLSNWGSYSGVKDRYPHGMNIDGEWFFEDAKLADGDVWIGYGEMTE
jgi:hypothetical protein